MTGAIGVLSSKGSTWRSKVTSAMSSRDAAGESPRAVVWGMKGEHRTQGRWFTLQLRMRAMAAEREGQGGGREEPRQS